MRRLFLLSVLFVFFAACSADENGNGADASQSTKDPNLKCAAMISATSYLVTKGQAEKGAITSKKDQLFVMMLYLNSYAIPKGLKEPEAFEELEAQRDTLTSSLSSAEIVVEANRCMENSPQ